MRQIPGGWVLLVLAMACAEKGTGDAADSASSSDVPTWSEDVQPIFARSCDGCHGAGVAAAGGPSLPDHAAAKAMAPAIATVVANRTMPPWHNDSTCREYVGDFSLSDAEIDTIVQWAEGGAPAGPARAPQTDGAWAPPTLDRVDLTLVPAGPVEMRAAPDDYRCVLIEWPYTEDVWVTGFEVRPDNLATVHHVIPFLIEPGDADTYRALDAADPGEGYTCYGGPGGDIDSLARTRWLGSWAPGSGATVLPEGFGLRVPPGSLVALQLHYNGDGTEGPDQSAVDLRIEESPQRWADVQPWTDIAWVAGLGMEIPAGTTGVSHTFRYTAQRGDRFAFRSASLHMHQLGRAAEMKVLRANGDEECLVRTDRWDFNWQRSADFATPVEVAPGDEIVLSCTWDNPGSADVGWGEGTGDEMCLGVTLITDVDD